MKRIFTILAIFAFVFILAIPVLAQLDSVLTDSLSQALFEKLQGVFGKLDFTAIFIGAGLITLATNFIKKLPIPFFKGEEGVFNGALLVPVFVLSFGYTYAMPVTMTFLARVGYTLAIGAISSGLWETFKKLFKKLGTAIG